MPLEPDAWPGAVIRAGGAGGRPSGQGDGPDSLSGGIITHIR